MYAHEFLRRVHGRDYTITIANKYVSSSVQEKAYFASAYAKIGSDTIPLTYVEKAYKKPPPCHVAGRGCDVSVLVVRCDVRMHMSVTILSHAFMHEQMAVKPCDDSYVYYQYESAETG